jgi:hypothetical protein
LGTRSSFAVSGVAGHATARPSCKPDGSDVDFDAFRGFVAIFGLRCARY